LRRGGVISPRKHDHDLNLAKLLNCLRLVNQSSSISVMLHRETLQEYL
jgi:hypothetical protein